MKKRLFFLPMVAIMMAACSSNETIEVNENKGDLISFRPIVKGVTLQCGGFQYWYDLKPVFQQRDFHQDIWHVHFSHEVLLAYQQSGFLCL